MCVAVSISYNDNYYCMSASTEVDMPLKTKKQMEVSVV